MEGRKRRGIKIRYFLYTLLIFSIFFVANTKFVEAKQDISSVNIRQAYAQGSYISVYLDIRDKENKAYLELTKDQISATLASQNLIIDNLSTFENTDEGIAYVFLVDISKSVNPTQFKDMQKAMNFWIDNLHDNDRVAIISFGESVELINLFTDDKDLLKKEINNLKAVDNQTLLYKGLNRALDIGKFGGENFPTRKIIIVLSDGEDSEKTGAISKEELVNKIKEAPIPIYTLGVFTSERKREHLNTLAEFSRSSGGEYFEITSQKIETIYSDIRENLYDSYLLKLICEDCITDGQVNRLTITINDSELKLSQGIDLRLQPGPIYKKESEATIHLEAETNDEVTTVVDEKSTSLIDKIKDNILISVITITLILLSVLIMSILLIRKKRSANLQKLTQVSNNNSTLYDENNSYQKELDNHLSKKSLGKNIALKFTIMNNQNLKQSFETEVSDYITLGRDADLNSISIPDDEISSQHCEILIKDSSLLIKDLNSKNGTYINGVPIKGSYKLESGDVILIGKTEFRISFINV